MNSKPNDLFVKHDIFYPSRNAGFSIWGKTGLVLFSRFKDIVSRRLEQIGYAQILLPSVTDKEILNRHIYDESKTSLLVEAQYNREKKLALRPFSEANYVEHAVRNPKLEYLRKVFQWGLCYYNEAQPNLYLNFSELTKCEIFSLHNQYKAAEKTWNLLNDCFKDVCFRELDLYPLYGRRPRISVFPFSKCSFVGEISIGSECFQTLLVSHIMKDIKGGLAGRQKMLLCSAGMSQKILSSMLINHSDKLGFRFPPALAPALGLVVHINKDRAEHYLKMTKDEQRISHLFVEDINIPSLLVGTGAIWSLQETQAFKGKSSWLLWKRGDLDAHKPMIRDYSKALYYAESYVEEYKNQLYTESRNRLLETVAFIGSIENIRTDSCGNAGKNNIFVPCCDQIACQAELTRSIRWIPKLAFDNRDLIRCNICGTRTRVGIMFEHKEQYSSFYVSEEKDALSDRS